MNTKTSAAQSARHQRCLDAIACRPVDRAPTYIPAIACDVASELLGRKVHTGTGSLHFAEVAAWARGEAAHADFENQLMIDLRDLHRQLDIDVMRMPWRMNAKPTLKIDEHTFLFGEPAGDHVVWQYNENSADFGVVESVEMTPPPEDALERWIEAEETRLKETENQAMELPLTQRQLFENFGDEFFVICSGGDISVGLGEEDLITLMLQPEWVRRKMMIKAEHGIRLGRCLAKSGAPKVMLGGGDLASNRGPIYSPESFRNVVLPAYKQMIAQLNALDVHYVFRSDGELWSLTQMLFGEAACPGFGEVDRDATMCVGTLRSRFAKLVLWGNVSSNFLQHATVNEVKEESRKIIEESQGRGYFHGCSNAIIKGTPAKNVEALFSVR